MEDFLVSLLGDGEPGLTLVLGRPPRGGRCYKVFFFKHYFGADVRGNSGSGAKLQDSTGYKVLHTR